MGENAFTIVICTRNRPQDLALCLQSILHQTHPVYEVVIVDASTGGASRDAVERLRPGAAFPFRYVQSRPGLTRQRNLGIRKSSGDILAFLDDDVVLEPRYIEHMADCFKRFPALAGATGHIRNNPPKVPFETWLKWFFMLAGTGRRGVMLRSGFAAFLDPQYVRDVKPTQVLSGCNMLYRRTILDRYRFDEAFEGYSQMEDVEFSHRVSKHHPLMYVKKAELDHHRSDTGRIDLRAFFEMSAFNHFYIFTKNVKQSPADWFFFCWSDLGHALKCLQWTLITRNGMAARGFIRAHLKMLRHRQRERMRRRFHAVN